MSSIITHDYNKSTGNPHGRRESPFAYASPIVGSPIPPPIGNPPPRPDLTIQEQHEKLDADRGKSKPSTAVKPYMTHCEQGDWTLVSRQGDKSRFRCHSWRHEGDCARWVNAQTFVRIRDAAKNHPIKPLYMVLTMSRVMFRGIPTDNQAKRTAKAYRKVYEAFTLFHHRMAYHYGKMAYVALIERHKDGFPHLNLIIHNQAMYDLAQGEMDLQPKDRPWKGMVEGILEECGFGRICYIDPVRSVDEIAGYFTKLIAEASKTLQLPTNAPEGFRRLRASRGYLPPTKAQLSAKVVKALGIVEKGALVRFPIECVEVSPRIQLTNRVQSVYSTPVSTSNSEDGDAKHPCVYALPLLREANNPIVDERVTPIPPVGVEAAVFTAEH